MSKDEGSEFEWSKADLWEVDVIRVGSDVVVRFRGLPLMSYPLSDPVARDVTIASLLRIGLTGERVAKLVRMSTGHVSQVKSKVSEGGVSALAERSPMGRRRLLSTVKERREVRRLHAAGHSQGESARRLDVSVAVVRRVERELGLSRRRGPQQMPLAGVGEVGGTEKRPRARQRRRTSETAEASLRSDSDEDPARRVRDERLPPGLERSPRSESEPEPEPEPGPAVPGETLSPGLDRSPRSESEPEPESERGPAVPGETLPPGLERSLPLEQEDKPARLMPGEPLPPGSAQHCSTYAATLLLAAAMTKLGVPKALDRAGVQRSNRAAYDGRQVCVALTCAWVAGHGSLEAMHERDARGLGVVLGLERAPSVRTLHRAIEQMVRRYDPIALGHHLMNGLAAAFSEEPLVYGVDGHHKQYTGSAPIDKGWNSKARMATKGLADVLVHDSRGLTHWAVQVGVGDRLNEHLPTVARMLRRTHGTERPLVLAVDRGGFAIDTLNELSAEGVYYISWVPATVSMPALDAIAPSEDGYGETMWSHPKLRHLCRLLVQRDGTALLPVATNLPVGGAGEVIVLLRKLRGVEENSIKAARRTVHIDRLVDRGICSERPDDRLVDHPERKRLSQRIRQLDARIEHAEQVMEASKSGWTADYVAAHLEQNLCVLQRDALPAKVPRHQIEPRARRAFLATDKRGLLQPLKYAADNARRWLLERLGVALAPSDSVHHATALPRTLEALLRATGSVRFAHDHVAVTIDLQLPPTHHARLDAALRSLDDLRLPFAQDTRPVRFELAPRPCRQTLPHRVLETRAA